MKKPGIREATGAVDKKLIFSLNTSRLPTWRQFTYISRFLTARERLSVRIASIIIIVSLGIVGVNIYRNHIVLVPARGGSYTEILTGTPNFFNPLYSSINTVDSDLTALVYSGLLKRAPDNALVPDLAESYSVSEDGRVYTFQIKQNVQWHDGDPFGTDDVVFTFAAMVNPEYESPLQRSFTGTTVTAVDEHTVAFTLAEPYAGFLELLTVGILPVHLWQQIPPSGARLADLNTKPVGTGPYRFASLTRDKNGTIRSYELAANGSYLMHKPYIATLIFKFSPNFQEGVNALNEGRAEGIDYLPREQVDNLVAVQTYTRHYLNQPQFTALFFNQNNLGALTDVRVKQALAYALNKQSLITDPAYTSVVEGPIMPLFADYYNADITHYPYDIAQANELLDAAGWRVVEVPDTPAEADADAAAADTNESAKDADEDKVTPEPGTWRMKSGERLEVVITTVDQSDTLALAESIKRAWDELHIATIINAVPPQQIQIDVIRPRAYQALLYGVVLGSDPDQYPFWHSSQISANGLNLANYNNKRIDELLEDARTTTDTALRQEAYRQFQDIITRDLPAIFLYSQKYLYVQSKNIKGFAAQSITVPSDRFSNINDWYTKTKKKFVWRPLRSSDNLPRGTAGETSKPE